MKLIKLILENIKSYQYQEISFNEGINCILGLNGSGKTTIIESIGFILFDYCPRGSNKMIRYHEKKASIQLDFEGDDNQIYRLIRTIKNRGNNTVKIIDISNDTILYETASDVYKFVAKVLNISSDKSLSKLYEEIIAVPQGKFVNAFLETPARRKDNFDKLLELDKYKSYGEHIKKTTDYLKLEKLLSLEKSLAVFKAKTENFAIRKEEQKNLNLLITEISLELEKTNRDIKALELEKENYDNLLLNNNQLKAEYNLLQERIKNLKVNYLENQANFEKTSAAKKIIEKTEFKYQRYLANEKKLQALEINQSKYLDCEKSYNLCLRDINELAIKMENLTKSMKEMKYNKGLLLEEKEDHLNKENEENNKSIALQKEIAEIDDNIKKDESLLEKDIFNNTYYLSNLESFQNSLVQEINNAVSTENVSKRLMEIDIKQQEILKSKEQIFLLEKEMALIYAEINNLTQNVRMISAGECPILRQPCLNTKGKNLLDEVNERLKNKEKQVTDIQNEIKVLNLQINYEEELQQEKRALELQLQRAQDNEERLANLEIDLDHKFSYYLKASKLSNLQDKMNYLKEKLSYEKNFLHNRTLDLAKLTSQKEKLRNDYTTAQVHIVNHENRLKSIIKEINQLDLKIKELETQKNSLNDLIVSQNNDKVNYQLIMESLGDSQIEITQLKDSLAKLKEDHLLYLTNLSLANQHSELANKNNDICQEIANLENESKSKEQEFYQFEEKIKTFDFLSLTKKYNETNKKIGSLNEALTEKKQQLKNINNEISEMEKLLLQASDCQEEYQKAQKVLNFLGIAREIITNLPKELSLQYREYIGSLASMIYSTISSENIHLEIGEDYGVILKDNSDHNKIKTIEQLSGGEQMSVAIAIRLAMLRQIAGVDIYFLDEPTINLDIERRRQVAEVMKDISHILSQLFVISHDDTFDDITNNVIKIIKNNNVSEISE